MTQTVSALSERERQALRLLLAGHDAKSSARELDISVHTLNDRLRSARRKLGVSSSKEAARILASSEPQISDIRPTNAPKSFVHTPFGMANADAASEYADLNQSQSHAGSSRAVWLTGGMLTMSVTIAAAIFLFAVSGGETVRETSPAAEEVDTKTADAQALSRARVFLDRVDASDWEGSWEVSGEQFQSQVTVKEWADQISEVREPLGAVDSRELSLVQRANSLPGTPAGEFQVFQFETRFERERGRSIETVVMMRGSEGWEVSGYFIA